MILAKELAQKSKQWGLEPHILEKDYVLGWLLWGIAKHPVLSKQWILKGGACIKKCFVDTHRYSQDLDFTVLPSGVWQPDELKLIFDEILEEVTKASGINFNVSKPKFELRPHGGSTEAKIYYVGPRNNPEPTVAKLDITQAEDIMRPPVLRNISHSYSDTFPDNTPIYCYSLEELFAEKLRAISERHRPSDLYDTIYLFRRSDLNAEPELILDILELKCDFKEIPIPNFELSSSSEAQEETEKRWQKMLGRSLGFIPDFEDYWAELNNLFLWLTGQVYSGDLERINEDDAWEAPSIEWQYGQSEWLEPIRYAAVNRLLVNLGYQGSYRVVEPYSLRSTRGGAILFYALKHETREIRGYRVDRVQSIDVTKIPFEPAFPIEFTPKGRIFAPLTRRRSRFISRSSRNYNYVIECSYCRKRFYRKKYSTRINPHKQTGSNLQCPGRHGYVI